MTEWETYAQAIFGASALRNSMCTGLTVSGPEDVPKGEVEMSAKKTNKKSTIVLETDEDGLPLIPEPLPTAKQDVDAVTRQFMAGYYSELQLSTIYCAILKADRDQCGQPEGTSPMVKAHCRPGDIHLRRACPNKLSAV
jgi:hypothetical protein